jgi:hypothetical protein
MLPQRASRHFVASRRRRVHARPSDTKRITCARLQAYRRRNRRGGSGGDEPAGRSRSRSGCSANGPCADAQRVSAPSAANADRPNNPATSVHWTSRELIAAGSNNHQVPSSSKTMSRSGRASAKASPCEAFTRIFVPPPVSIRNGIKGRRSSNSSKSESLMR